MVALNNKLLRHKLVPVSTKNIQFLKSARMSKKNSRYMLSLFLYLNFMHIKCICILNDFKNNVKGLV